MKELQFYMEQICKIPLLKKEQEKVLGEKASRGDKDARKKLIESNLRLVVKIAGSYKGWMDMEDLVNEGNIGLMRAAETFDPSKSNKFSTYAQYWIRDFIMKAIRDTSTGIRFPATQYKEMKKSRWTISSLDTPVFNDDEETTLLAIVRDKSLTPEEEFYENNAVKKLRKQLTRLSKLEMKILTMRYGLDGNDPKSLSEIGTVLNYSKERIRQLEKGALEKLRERINTTDVA